MKTTRSRLPRVVAASGLLIALASSTPALAGDAFFRGGIIFHPTDLGIEGRWRVDFGSDYAVNYSETVYVGFEVQTSVYRQDVMGGGSATFVPLDGFVNVKVKSGNIGARPYGGGGLGLISQFSRIEGDFDWDNALGFHLLGGVDLGRLSLELQMQRAFESGSATTWAAYAGFLF